MSSDNSRLLPDGLTPIDFEPLKKLDEDCAAAIYKTLGAIPLSSRDIRSKVEKLSRAHVATSVAFSTLVTEYWNFPSMFESIVSVEPVDGVTADALKAGLLEIIEQNLTNATKAQENRKAIHKQMNSLVNEIRTSVDEEVEALRKSEEALNTTTTSSDDSKESEEGAGVAGAISGVAKMASVLLGPEGVALDTVFEVAKTLGLGFFKQREQFKQALSAIDANKARELLERLKKDSEDLKQVLEGLQDVSSLLNSSTEPFNTAIAFWKAVQYRIKALKDRDLRANPASLAKAWSKFLGKKPSPPQLVTVKKTEYPPGVANFLSTEKPDEHIKQLLESLKAPNLGSLKDVKEKSNIVTEKLEVIMKIFVTDSNETNLSKYFLERKQSYTQTRLKAQSLAHSLSTGAEIHIDILEAMMGNDIDEQFYSTVILVLRDGAVELRDRSKAVCADLLVFKDAMSQSTALVEKAIENYNNAVTSLNKSKEDLAQRLAKAKQQEQQNILSQIFNTVQGIFNSIGIPVNLKGLFGGDPVGALQNEIRNVEIKITNTKKAAAEAKKSLPIIGEVIEIVQSQGELWNQISLNMDTIATKYGVMAKGKVWLKIEGKKIIETWKVAKAQADQFVKDDSLARGGGLNFLSPKGKKLKDEKAPGSPKFSSPKKTHRVQGSTGANKEVPAYLKWVAGKGFHMTIKDVLYFRETFKDIDIDVLHLREWLDNLEKFWKTITNGKNLRGANVDEDADEDADENADADADEDEDEDADADDGEEERSRTVKSHSRSNSKSSTRSHSRSNSRSYSRDDDQDEDADADDNGEEQADADDDDHTHSDEHHDADEDADADMDADEDARGEGDFDADDSLIDNEDNPSPVDFCFVRRDADEISSSTKSGLANVNKLWKKSEVTVQFVDKKVNPVVARAIERIANKWAKYTGIKFVFVKKGGDVRITLKGKGCWSKLGTDALRNKPKPSMQLGWGKARRMLRQNPLLFRRNVLHEFGHVLGLDHEHMHNLANIPWDVEKVKEAYSDWNEDEINLNLFYVPDIKQEVVTKALKDSEGFAKIKDSTGIEWAFSDYDRDSIMHYPVPLHLLQSGTSIRFFEISLNCKLSVKDKLFVTLLYQPQRLANK